MDDERGATGLEPQDRLAEEAVRRIKAKRDFRGHLLVYLLVNTLLVLIWLTIAITAGAWFPWPVFPLAGWGIGLLLHAWAVYGSPSRPITDEDIAQEIQRMRGRPSGRRPGPPPG
jgi:hypothetical protein